MSQSLVQMRQKKDQKPKNKPEISADLKLLLPNYDNLSNRDTLNDVAMSSIFPSVDYGKNQDDLDFAKKALNGSKFEFWVDCQKHMMTELGASNIANVRGPTLSPRQYIEECFVNNMDSVALKIAENFRFSNEQIEYIRIHGYIKRGKWDLFDNYSRSEPKYIKWSGVAAELARQQFKDRAIKIANLMKPNDMFAFLEEFQYWQEALNAAIAKGDLQRVQKYKEILNRH